MNRKELVNQIMTKKSFLCVGLDTDMKKIPQHLLKEEDPIFAFNKAIIATLHPQHTHTHTHTLPIFSSFPILQFRL